MRPRRQDGRKIVLACAVRINVGFHLLTGRAGVGDQADQFRHLAPQLMIGQLQMNNIDGNAGAAADFKRFGHGLKDALAFRAHVR